VSEYAEPKTAGEWLDEIKALKKANGQMADLILDKEEQRAKLEAEVNALRGIIGLLSSAEVNKLKTRARLNGRTATADLLAAEEFSRGKRES
jgi:Spy/CpxP family protein refolding chaperone